MQKSISKTSGLCLYKSQCLEKQTNKWHWGCYSCKKSKEKHSIQHIVYEYWLDARFSSPLPISSKDCKRHFRDNWRNLNKDCIQDNILELI